MASRVRWINVGAVDSVGSATVTAATDTITVTSHGLADGDLVAFDTISGAAPLEEGVTYFVRGVAGDDFQVSGSRGGNVLDISSDGTAEAYTSVPEYSAEELRQTDSHTLFHGSANRLGAREGVRPGAGVPVTVAAGNYQVQTHTGTVEPAESSTQGPYTYVQLQTTPAALDPADGSNDRIDAIDVQVSDDDADGSGGRGHAIIYTAGTPAGSPTAPLAPARSMRLATILVPAGDETAATVDDSAQWTVASGGTLPVRGTSERPTTGRYPGMLTYRQDTDELEAWTGAAWEAMASPDVFVFISALMGWQWDHAASSVDSTTDTLTALAGGPEVVVDVPDSGNVLVMWGGRVEFDTASETVLARWRIQMSGTNAGTVSGTSVTWSARQSTGSDTSNYQSKHSFHVQTGLSPGATTFTSEYACSQGSGAATASFDRRSLLVVPLGEMS